MKLFFRDKITCHLYFIEFLLIFEEDNPFFMRTFEEKVKKNHINEKISSKNLKIVTMGVH